MNLNSINFNNHYEMCEDRCHEKPGMGNGNIQWKLDDMTKTALSRPGEELMAHTAERRMHCGLN